MNQKRLERILLLALMVIAGIIYLITVAPTLSFWDCGEFISCSYSLGVPHPPGTPLFIIIGRVWLIAVGLFAAILPISKEVAWHMNLMGITFTLATIALVYKMLILIFRMWKKETRPAMAIWTAFAASLITAFFYTVWENAVETEVYATCTFVVVLVNYLALAWYEGVRAGAVKNRYILFCFYLIYLATGIHLTPFLVFIPFYAFIFYVERRYLKDWLLILLGVFQLVLFPLLFLLPTSLFVPGLVVLGLVLFTGLVATLAWPHRCRNYGFFWIGVLLIIVAFSSELFLYIRSKKLTQLYKDPVVTEQYLAGKNVAPRINECEPGKSLAAFNDVLHRAQYGPQRIYPRQTMDQTGYGLVEGYFWQMALMIRYLSWQVAPENLPALVRGLILLIFYFLGILGMVELYKRERKIFLLNILIMFLLTFGIVTYLNLKFSPSDSNPKHQLREVRERDYFFHTTDVYFGIFLGMGLFGIVEWAGNELNKQRLVELLALGSATAYALIPLAGNWKHVSRYGNFTPKDYGYNMLKTCEPTGVLFTNGDNDTFPLWFAQEVLAFRRGVVIANLSLINTDWYIRQLKSWGVPIRFSEYVIGRLQPFITQDRRVVYVKDIMIRHIIASNAGIELTNEDYVIPQEQFAQKYLKGYKGRIPIYFASTVAVENYEGFLPYLKLEGLVYRLVGDSLTIADAVDLEKTSDFFYRVYRYTGLFPPEVQPELSRYLEDFDQRKKEGEFYTFALPKDDNTQRLYGNYAAGLFSLGMALKERGDIAGTLRAWRFALLFEPVPRYPFLFNTGLVYAQLGMADSAEHFFSQIDLPDAQIMAQIGGVYRTFGFSGRAVDYFKKAIVLNPRTPQAYLGLMTAYLDLNDTLSATGVLREWLRLNPGDTSAASLLRELTEKR